MSHIWFPFIGLNFLRDKVVIFFSPSSFFVSNCLLRHCADILVFSVWCHPKMTWRWCGFAWFRNDNEERWGKHCFGGALGFLIHRPVSSGILSASIFWAMTLYLGSKAFANYLGLIHINICLSKVLYVPVSAVRDRTVSFKSIYVQDFIS